MKNKNLILVILFFPILLYINTLGNKYSFDDNYAIYKNDQIHKGISAIPEIFTSHYFSEKNDTFGYRPVSRTIFAIEYSIFGQNPFVSHLINILLYSLLCFILFNFLLQIFSNIHISIITLIIIVFASHPIHTEVVASVKNREELLAMIFGMLALLIFVKYLKKPNWGYLVIIPFLLILAILSKENAVTYSLIIPVIYLVKQDNFKLNHLKKGLPIFLIVIIYIVISYFTWKLPEYILTAGDKILYNFENPLHNGYSFFEKTFIIGNSLWFYFKMMIIPFPLLYYYGYNMFPESGINIILAFSSIIIYFSLFIYAILKINKKREFAFLILFYCISIFVFSNYLMPVNGIVAERLSFQASFGFIGFIVLLISEIKNKKSKIEFKNLDKWKKITFILLIIVFSSFTINRNFDWKNYESLLEADINKMEKSAKGQVVYASWYFGEYVKKIQNNQQPNQKILNKIITRYRKSVIIDTNYYSSYNNLGYIYLNFKSNIDSSLFFYLKAIHANPNYLEANYGAGICYLKRNDFEKANSFFKKAIEIDSLYTPAWIEYAKIKFSNSDATTAFKILNNVAKLDTISDLAYITLGNFSLLKSDTSSAVEYWEQAIQRNPNNPQLLFGLYKYFSQIKKVEKSTHYKNLFEKFSVK